jgi:hypothetical protein
VNVLRAIRFPTIFQLGTAKGERSEVTPVRKSTQVLFIFCALLLIIFASRIVRLHTVEMDVDETWSVWQTFGSPADIIRWTPYDWTPVYYLMVGGWRVLTGINPFAVRLLSLYPYLIAMAILFRIVKRIATPSAALLAVAACSAMGYAIHLGIYVRVYSFIFTMAILAWWLAIRYFTKPTIPRGLVLSAAMIGLMYLHVTAAFALLIIGLYTLAVYRWQVWRWWFPLLIAVIFCIPEVAGLRGTLAGHAVEYGTLMSKWLAGTAGILRGVTQELLVDFVGYNFSLWMSLLFIASMLLVEHYRFSRTTRGLGIFLLAPFLGVVMGFFGAFTNRHLTWIMAGVAAWIAVGWSKLPKVAIAALLIVFAVLMFLPAPINERYKPIAIKAEIIQMYSWMASRVQPEDVVLVDPNFNGLMPEEWDYYTRAYFPQGLHYVTKPEAYKRIWFIFADGLQNQDLFAQIQDHRIITAQEGTAKFLVRLYEAPPDLTGQLYANGMRFHGVQILGGGTGPYPVYHEAEKVKLRLWWSTDDVQKLDYSVGTYLTGAKGTVAQFDGPPQIVGGPKETSRWKPKQYYVEEREIQLPYPTENGQYGLLLTVYQWWDNVKVTGEATNPEGLMALPSVTVKAW